MRGLQVIGIIISILFALYGFWKRKQRKFSRSQFVIIAFIAAALFLISLIPSFGDLLARPLRMDRWNAVLFSANVMLFGLFLYLLNMMNRNSRSISRLIKGLAANKLAQEMSLGNDQLLVLIPAYNEEENIGMVLDQMPDTVMGLKINTLVAVDGATDNTEQVARAHGAQVVVNPINRGGGAALRAGYEIALRSGAEIVVTLDADGQHLPQEIERLVAPILEGEADFVNGSRVLGTHEAESQVRVAGVVLFNWLITVLMGQRITDASNAFRAIRRDVLEQVDLQQDQFHTSEILIEAIKKGFRVSEVPITILKRHSGETKKPPSARYAWGFTKAIVGTWLR